MAKKKLKEGVFITFEGPEGCGKSTQSRLLCDYLRSRRYDCVYTREPGGTKMGERVRDILLHSKGVRISDLAELFLFESCRAQITDEIIRPAIKKGSIVVCDRFSDATLTYQGYGGGLLVSKIRTLDDIATDGLKPDLTILLDIDTVTGLKRARAKGLDRIENKDMAYHKRVRAGYLKLSRQEPSRIKVIKTTGSIAKTQNAVRDEVKIVIQGYRRPG